MIVLISNIGMVVTASVKRYFYKKDSMYNIIMEFSRKVYLLILRKEY